MDFNTNGCLCHIKGLILLGYTSICPPVETPLAAIFEIKVFQMSVVNPQQRKYSTALILAQQRTLVHHVHL